MQEKNILQITRYDGTSVTVYRVRAEDAIEEVISSPFFRVHDDRTGRDSYPSDYDEAIEHAEELTDGEEVDRYEVPYGEIDDE